MSKKNRSCQHDQNTLGRRLFLKTIATSTILTASTTWLTCNGQKQKPNIIFLLADDHRWDAMGCMGNPFISTPNLDQLASHGFIFDNAFITSPVCMGSRASIMLGQFESRNECNFRNHTISRAQYDCSYPALLRKAGYRTGFIGKFGFAVTPEKEKEVWPDEKWIYENNMPKDYFDFWAGFPGQGVYDMNILAKRYPQFLKYAQQSKHLTAGMGRIAHEFLESCSPEQPFCLSISFKAPHAPYQPDPDYQDLYANKTIPKPANYGDKYFKNLPYFQKNSRQRMYFEKDWRGALYDQNIDLYFQLISGIDRVVGQIRQDLQELGMDKNTIIIYSSDNGYFCGSKGLGGKMQLYEESIRAPLIIYDPRNEYEQQHRITDFVMNIDFAPTILSLADVSVPDHMQGKSLLPLVRNQPTVWRDSVFFENTNGLHCERSVSVRNDRFKYIRYFKRQPVVEELFDIQKDPIEVNNLAGRTSYKKDLDHMRNLCDLWIDKAK